MLMAKCCSSKGKGMMNIKEVMMENMEKKPAIKLKGTAKERFVKSRNTKKK